MKNDREQIAAHASRYTEWADLKLYEIITSRTPELHSDFATLRAAQESADRRYIRTAEDMSGRAADEVINFNVIGGNTGCMTRGEIMLHVVNHKTYHRGHIADMLFQIHVQPPTTDLPVSLRVAH
jgi:uncharacterized damage-inducible protein DinB